MRILKVSLPRFLKRFDNFKIFVYKRINHISNCIFEIASIARVNARSVLIAWYNGVPDSLNLKYHEQWPSRLAPVFRFALWPKYIPNTHRRWISRLISNDKPLSRVLNWPRFLPAVKQINLPQGSGWYLMLIVDIQINVQIWNIPLTCTKSALTSSDTLAAITEISFARTHENHRFPHHCLKNHPAI